MYKFDEEAEVTDIEVSKELEVREKTSVFHFYMMSYQTNSIYLYAPLFRSVTILLRYVLPSKDQQFHEIYLVRGFFFICVMMYLTEKSTVTFEQKNKSMPSRSEDKMGAE